jgi:ABC transporter, substrate-binding protein, aliphatic sulfonates family
MKMKKFVWLSLSAILLLSLLSGCAGAAKPATVRIGTQPWIGYGPWWIAKEKGMFAKYGLNVELVDFVEDKEVNAAFASGDMDAANLATHTAIKLYSSGLDLKVVLLEDVSTSADAILADKSITSIADLKGKSVAYEEGTTSDLLLNYALSQNNMTLADITPVPMPASDAGAALLAGNVPAAVTYEPYISEVVKQSGSVSVLYKAGERPGLISDVLVVNSKWAAANPDTVSKLLKVWDEALAYYNENPSDAQAIIAKAVGSEPADLVTAFDGVKFYSAAENQKALTGDFTTTIQDVAAVSKTIGLFDTIPDLSKLIDSSYLK